MKDYFIIRYGQFVVNNGGESTEETLKAFKQHLVDITGSVEICGHYLEIGDYVKVKFHTDGHLDGGRIEGKIKEIYPHIPQVKLENGWCFHPNDEILIHKAKTETEQA
jgi:hypothetical protein